MNAAILLIPIIIVRYFLPWKHNKETLKRTALFAPTVGNEKIAFFIYHMATIFIVVYLFFVRVNPASSVFYPGITFYVLGVGILTVSIVNFSNPSESGINVDGLYSVPRNPMYLAYFLCFIGCALMSQSIILFAAVGLFQAATYWIIVSEERWCIDKFGREYIEYMSKVRRYI